METSRCLRWIRVSPTDPRTIYAGGQFLGGDGGQVWLARSTAAGTTWQDLSDAGGLYNYYLCGGGGTCSSGFAYTPLVVGADGTHLYAAGGFSGPSPAGGSSSLFISADRGLSWVQTGAGAQYTTK